VVHSTAPPCTAPRSTQPRFVHCGMNMHTECETDSPCGRSLWTVPVDGPCGRSLWTVPVDGPCGRCLWQRLRTCTCPARVASRPYIAASSASLSLMTCRECCMEACSCCRRLLWSSRVAITKNSSATACTWHGVVWWKAEHSTTWTLSILMSRGLLTESPPTKEWLCQADTVTVFNVAAHGRRGGTRGKPK
jgi:hypothetical protein